MGMVTTCPHCRTAFRVTAEQLDAHGGDVRCGRCGQVFNARDSLAAETVEALPPGLAPVEAAAEIHEEIEIPPLPEEPPEAPAPNPPATLLPEQESMPAVVAEEAPPAEETPRRRSRSWLWGIASFLLLAGLMFQGAYFYRTDLAARYPTIKPYLEQFCGQVGCVVPLPRYPDLLSIETSALEADPDRPNVVVLNAVLRNRAAFVQAYPSLELTLTDAEDKPAARRVFSPKEYLPKSADPSRGMPANQDVAVKLPMDLGALKAVGYRLYLFYP